MAMLCQWVVVPAFAWALVSLAVPAFDLPKSVGLGLMLVRAFRCS